MKTIPIVAGLVSLFGLALAPGAQADELTVTGCLEEGHESGEYELTNVSGGESDEYELIASEDVKLGPHVGHKVEITGSPASEADEGEGAESEKKESTHAHLKVSSMKHVAEDCP